MCEHVDNKYKNQDMGWLGKGMKEVSLVWCADRSCKAQGCPFHFWSSMDSAVHKVRSTQRMEIVLNF